MAPSTAAKQTESRLSIGQVLEHLGGEFGDLTPSKLRFLEDQGLITPERTNAGYRKFTQEHIERLRLILTLQRDHYLPLKVIADLLEQVDQGLDPEIPGGSERAFSTILGPKRVLDRAELQREAGVSSAFVSEAISAGLIPNVKVFPTDALVQLKALKTLAERGLTPRHLRAVQRTAVRHAELIEQSVGSRGRQAQSAFAEQALELSELLETVHNGIVKRLLTEPQR